jgi:hypothetical protein
LFSKDLVNHGLSLRNVTRIEEPVVIETEPAETVEVQALAERRGKEGLQVIEIESGDLPQSRNGTVARRA